MHWTGKQQYTEFHIFILWPGKTNKAEFFNFPAIHSLDTTVDLLARLLIFVMLASLFQPKNERRSAFNSCEKERKQDSHQPPCRGIKHGGVRYH